MGLLPTGTGNSLLTDMACTDVMEMATRIATGKVCNMDLVKVTVEGASVYSMNCLCLGLTGDVGVAAESFRCLGGARYDACAVWGVLKGKLEPYKIEYTTKDGERIVIEEDFVTAFANHTQYFGKKLRATPKAVLDDGLLDIMTIRNAKRAKALQLFTVLPDGQHMNDSVVDYIQAKAVTFTVQKPGVGVVDGELFQHRGTIELEVISGAFPFIGAETSSTEILSEV